MADGAADGRLEGITVGNIEEEFPAEDEKVEGSRLEEADGELLGFDDRVEDGVDDG